MAQTNLMRADEIAHSFNSVVDRKYWKAAVAGSRVNPEVHFNSRASMVRVSYRVTADDFTVAFSKTSVSFGDFLASVYRSMAQVLESLKAAGLPFSTPIDDSAALRVEYNPVSKVATVSLANVGDDWLTRMPTPFKVPDRNNLKNSLPAIDGL